MKLRTMAALAVGYGIGVRLGPERIEALLLSAFDGNAAGRTAAPHASSPESKVEWPDASFRI